MMDDSISRKEAIEVLNKLARDNFTLIREFAFYLGALHDAAVGIKNLPSAQQWIPCSKRLPDLDEDGYSDKVLVSFSNFTGCEICEYRIVDGKGD